MAIVLPAAFETELEKMENAPSILVEMTEGYLKNTQTSAADWTANSAESNVDYATISGSVILSEDTIPDESQSTNNAYVNAPMIIENPGTIDGYSAYQTFKQTTGGDVYFDTAVLNFWYVLAYQTSSVVAYILNGAGTQVLGGPIYASIDNPGSMGSGYVARSFDFSTYNILIEDNTTYRIYVAGFSLAPYSSGHTWGVWLAYNTAGGYANGFLYSSYTTSTIGDAKFSASFFGQIYETSGSIETQNMDIGETPANNGQWIIYDQKNGETITYAAEGSTTGAFAGEETLIGPIADGDAITNLYRYYRVISSLSTADKNVTPELQEITASFSETVKYSDNDTLGYPPVIKKVSSLTTSIGDFDNTTIGQMTITFARTPEIENFFLSGSVYPKNKPVLIKFGFIKEDLANPFTEASYVTFFAGAISNYRLDGKDWIIVTIKDNYAKLDVNLPSSVAIESNPATSPIVYTADHPIDVMLDILETQVSIRDSIIGSASFATVKTALPGWVVTRTITNDQENAKELLEELRKLMNCYLIPQATGSISIKQWNAAESAADSWDDDDFLPNGITWDGNAKTIVNQQTTYYDWDTTGDEYTNYDEVSVTVNSASQTNYDEVLERLRKDKWTLAAQSAQVTTYNSAKVARYANPPAIIETKNALSKLKYEVGDIIDITTARAIGAALGGITDEAFQITNKNLDFQRGTLTFKLLQVAG